jgi:Ribbon-helix-helix protein, copG family
MSCCDDGLLYNVRSDKRCYMTRQYLLRVRLTEQEKQKLETEARQRGISMSELIRDFVKSLPAPPLLK